jgi:hypothetical protein
MLRKCCVSFPKLQFKCSLITQLVARSLSSCENACLLNTCLHAIVSEKVGVSKLVCEQASITHMSKRTYYHEGELEYVIEIVIIFIRARLIARMCFGAMRASAVKFAGV